jgi:hypothetical protein
MKYFERTLRSVEVTTTRTKTRKKKEPFDLPNRQNGLGSCAERGSRVLHQAGSYNSHSGHQLMAIAAQELQQLYGANVSIWLENLLISF